MQREICLWAVALVVVLSAQAMAQMPSRLPPDVVLDYSYDAVHLMNGAGAPLYALDERYQRFLERLRQFPPDILIVGKEAPFTHHLGPILSFGGENRMFPRVPQRTGEDPRRLLSPAELRLRIRAIETFVQDAHAAGAKAVLPYISPMTMFGEPEKRLGFFAFYDSWDTYAQAFELGERPQPDPLEWSQRDRQGKLFFRMTADQPYYKPLRRYSMCINTPGWRKWQRLVTQWIVRVGYDGVWMDNALVHVCHEKYCQAIAEDIGGNLQQAPQRVWLEGYLRYFDDLRKEGAKTLAVNYGEIPFQQAVTDKVDLAMIEASWLGVSRLLWPGGVWTGFYPPMPNVKVLFNRTQGTREAQVLHNIWLVQLAYAMRGKRGTHFHYTAPAKAGSLQFVHNEDSAILALAEGATFGGGVAVNVVGSNANPFLDDNDLLSHQARQRFFTFARRRRQLYEGLSPAGDIAIVVFPDRGIEALLEAQQAHEILLWRGVLVDVLNGEIVSKAALKRYKLVIVPGQSELPKEMTALPLLRSPDPITDADLQPIIEASQKRREIPRLRRTKLEKEAVQRTGGLRALKLTQGSFVHGAAWADGHRLVLHLLNYRVPIGRDNGGKAEAVGEFAVRLRIPEGKKVKEVRSYTPGNGQPTLMKFQQEAETLNFTVSTLRVYGVCEVTF